MFWVHTVRLMCFLCRMVHWSNRLCGLAVRVPGYRSRSLGSIPWGPDLLSSSESGTSGPLSLMSTTEELLGRNSSGSGLEKREYGHKDPSCWPRGTLYQQKLAITSPTSGGRSVGIVHLWTQTTEFVCFVSLMVHWSSMYLNQGSDLSKELHINWLVFSIQCDMSEEYCKKCDCPSFTSIQQIIIFCNII
jgi:hypothetical protein